MTPRMFCNADVDAFLSGVPPSPRSWQRLHQVARVFALCGPVGTPVLVPGPGHAAVPLGQADLWRTHAAERGHHHAATVQSLPFWNPAPSLLAWGTDARAVALGDPGSVAVARAVNSKAFSQRVAAAHGWEPGVFRHACVVETMGALRAHLEGVPEEVAANWTLKPLWGFAGGGRVAGRGRTVQPAVEKAVLPLLHHDGAVVFEPWVSRVSDHSTQLWVAGPDDVRVVFQGTLLNTAGGRYLGNVDVVSPASPRATHHAALAATARAAGRALALEGYRGPAGVDALVYRDARLEGAETLRPLVEVNARFTLGWVAGVLARMARATGCVPPEADVRFRLSDGETGEHAPDAEAVTTGPGYRLEAAAEADAPA